jgi:hypothetical protein
VEAANELTRYMTLQSKLIDTRIGMQNELMELPGKIERQRELIRNCEDDIGAYALWNEAEMTASGKSGASEAATTSNGTVMSASDVASESVLAFTALESASVVVSAGRSGSEKEESEKRRALRSYITSEVKAYVLETREKRLMNYKGFDIILPANMTREKPYVWLVRSGRYYVELGESEKGNLVRIDNYIDRLEDHLEELRLNLSRMKERQVKLDAELAAGESYTDQIARCRKEVEALDRKLGVNKA